MADYLREPVDDLPFGSEAKARRYATERYQGAVGRNWYTGDPTLQLLLRRHLGADGLAWATPRLEHLGALMGGPIAERAEETDRHGPRLREVRPLGPRHQHGRHAGDVRGVPPRPHRAQLRLARLQGRGAAAPASTPAPLAAAWAYLLDQAEIGMMCALGTGGDMVVRLTEEFAPDDVKARVRELFAAGEYAGEAAQMLTERTGGSDLAALETTATPDGDGLAAQRVQVVRLQRQRLGLRGAGQAARRRRHHPQHRPVPRAARAPRRHPQRRAHPPPEGQARHQGRGLGRGRVRRRRGVPPRAVRQRRRIRGRRRPGHGADDGAHQRRPPRHRHDGPRLRPPGARRVALLRAAPGRPSAASSSTTR